MDRRAIVAAPLIWLAACGGSQPAATQVSSSGEFADSKQCRGCHAEIYDRYQKFGMGRSFAPVAQAGAAAGFTPSGSLAHTASGRRYDVVERDGRLIQRRVEGGDESTAFELEATHAVGSGNHARTFLHRTAQGEFVELPLTWYAHDKRWALSPGFDDPRLRDFTRLVDDRCLFCHNAYPSASGELASGIDCQRCHGPGQAHIERRGPIVNPAKLDADRRLDVCQQCHLETTSSDLPSMVRRFGRAVNSFRPGERLSDYVVQFDDGNGEKFEVVSQAYRLKQSACFVKSTGRLTCTTCHDPHGEPRGAQGAARQREACRGCHSSVAAPNHPALSSADCAGCHMPRRRTEDAVHVVLTDHKIQRRPPPGNLLRPLAEVRRSGRPALYDPPAMPARDSDLYLGIALIASGRHTAAGIEHIERQADLPPRAIAVLGEGYFAAKRFGESAAAFERAIAADPSLPGARHNLGRALEATGQIARARAAYEQVLDRPEAEFALANLLRQSGDAAAATGHYRRAIAMRPIYAEAHANLGSLLADQGSLDAARTSLEYALRIDPSLADAHNNLGRVLAGQGSLAAATIRIRRAVALDPSSVPARYNLARVLQASGAMRGAIAEYRRLLAAQPSFADAHAGLGQALADSNQLNAAIAEFREALRIQPGHPAARRDLDLALSIRQGTK